MKNLTILPSLTTTAGSNWKEKVSEIDRLGIKEMALFPTVLDMKQREELYSKLEKTGLEKIPHVHMRDDMKKEELTYLTERFGTEVFNLHAVPTARACLGYKDYIDRIFVENQEFIDDEFDYFLQRCAGICLDVSHWEDHGIIQHSKGYDRFESLAKNHSIGCCHISAIANEAIAYKHYITGQDLKYYSHHWLTDLSQLDYVKKYVQYLPKYVSIELENSFKEQLEIKQYLEKIINQ